MENDLFMPTSTQTYTPASILGVFQNSITVKEEKRLISIKGVYRKSGIKSYKGYYYDKLYDEGGAYCLSIKTHELYRQRITNGKVVCLEGYISRSLTKDGSIQISINLVDLKEQIN